LKHGLSRNISFSCGCCTNTANLSQEATPTSILDRRFLGTTWMACTGAVHGVPSDCAS